MSLTATVVALLALASPAPAAAAAPAAAQPAVAAETSATLVDRSGEWRGARWGMSVAEVLRHFSGEAQPMEPELKLANGSTVSVRVEGQKLVGHPLRAGFVFEEGKLALVSLRTLERDNAPPEAYVAAVKLLTGQLGAPRKAEADANFIDMRQTSWVLPRGAVDLKYIPGVLVLLYHPAAAGASAPSAAPATAAAPAPAPAPVEESGCKVRLSGVVTAEFECSLQAGYDEKTVTLVIAPIGDVAGLRSVVPARFELPYPLEARTYTLSTLGAGGSRAVLASGEVYLAAGARGEVTFEVGALERYSKPASRYRVTGGLKARLVPEKQGGAGEIHLDAVF